MQPLAPMSSPINKTRPIFFMTFDVAANDELSHAGPRTQADPRLPGKPDALPGVGCSDLRYAFAQRDSRELLPFLAAYRLTTNPIAAKNNAAATEDSIADQARSLVTSWSIIATNATPMGAANAIARNNTKNTCPIPHTKARDSLRSRSAEYSGCLNGVTLRRITSRICDPAPLTLGLQKQRNRGVRCIRF